MASKSQISELEQRIIGRWLKRPDGLRTAHDVLAFYGDLLLQQSPLLDFPYPGDKYQGLQSILRNHIERDS